MACLVGITGNSGCGQSTAAGFIAEHCSGVCSLDRIGHRILARAYVLRELADDFSRKDFLTMNEAEVRMELGSVVFDDIEKMNVLNSVLHPRMIRWASMTAAVLTGREGTWVLEGALIYELGIDRYLDYLVTVEDTIERSAEHLVIRDNISAEYAFKRWKHQLPIEVKSSRADYIVHNSKDLDYMKQQILTIFEEIENRQLI